MKTSMMLLLGLVSFSPAAMAQTTPANFYECKGNGVNVTYAIGTSFTGESTITFQFRNETITGTGKAIQTETTVLGDLVTLVRQSVPDSFTDTLTLVAPNINISDRLPAVPFTTRLFKTRTHTSIGGPALVEGVIQKSESQPLSCQAIKVF
jgi:hypothetical protein